MHRNPPASHNHWYFGKQLPALLLVTVAVASGQEPARFTPPPDFSQPAIANAAKTISFSWDAWIGTSKDLEQRAVHMSMSEARYLIQRTLGRYLDFLDARTSYADAVFSYIEQCTMHPTPRMRLVTAEDVYEDQSRLIGANVLLLHQNLSALKTSSEWITVYAGSQAEANQALKLQSTRHAEIPIVLSVESAPPPQAVSLLVYRKTEGELRETLQKLWTRYYQVLIDAIEQKPEGSLPLLAIRTEKGADTSGNPAIGQTAPASAVPEAWKSFVGVWSYAAGSQQFNGVAEPSSSLLEIWYENNTLMGRYRAEVPDFDGLKKLDLRLQGVPSPKSRQLTLHFESKEPPASGQLTLEPAGPSGIDIMLIRTVTPQNSIPRGRELLVRH